MRGVHPRVNRRGEVRSVVDLKLRPHVVRYEEQHILLICRQGNLEQQVQKNEREKGILGYGQVKEENEMISEQKEQIDQQKTQKLEQITEIVGNIQKELGTKKERLTKQVNQLKELKNVYNEIHS